ncbi:hypothetical protein BC835DRAFT_1420423 [Cytidiella melzeri]|nr:hypothetical protein BC835DRAFT_1420423 [Cytidiella melzeri]
MATNKSKSSAHFLRNKPHPVVPQSPDSSDNNAGGQNSNVESNSESEDDVLMEDLAPKEQVMAIHAALITVRVYINNPVLKWLVSKARWLPRIAGMVSDNMDDIFSFGAKVGGTMIEEGSQIWKELKAGSATFKECFQLLLAFMAKHASAAQRDNIAGLKCSIHNYIISEEPIPAGTPKNQLGWGNITTTRLLVPQHMRVAFDRNPTSFCNAVTSGKKDITKDILAKNLPSFLWDNDKELDCKMFNKGLLRGPLLLKGGKEDSEDALGLLQVYGNIGDQADFESDSVSAGSGSNSEHSDNSGNKKEYGNGWP